MFLALYVQGLSRDKGVGGERRTVRFPAHLTVAVFGAQERCIDCEANRATQTTSPDHDGVPLSNAQARHGVASHAMNGNKEGYASSYRKTREGRRQFIGP